MIIKYTFENTTRRFTIDPDKVEKFSFSKLKKVILKSLGNEYENKELIAQYTDEDDDTITVTRTAELQSAISWTMESSDILRLKISFEDFSGLGDSDDDQESDVDANSLQSGSITDIEDENEANQDEVKKGGVFNEDKDSVEREKALNENEDEISEEKKRTESQKEESENSFVKNPFVRAMDESSMSYTSVSNDLNAYTSLDKQPPFISLSRGPRSNPSRTNENPENELPKTSSTDSKGEGEDDDPFNSFLPLLMAFLQSGVPGLSGSLGSKIIPLLPLLGNFFSSSNDSNDCFKNKIKVFIDLLSVKENVLSIQEFCSSEEVSNFIKDEQSISLLSISKIIEPLILLISKVPEILRLIPLLLEFYSLGAEAKKDQGKLHSSNSSTSTPVNSYIWGHVICDGCDESDNLKSQSIKGDSRCIKTGSIKGMRYKSAVKENYDLCTTCYNSGKFEESYGPFICIQSPEKTPQAIFCILKDDDETENKNWRRCARQRFRSAMRETRHHCGRNSRNHQNANHCKRRTNKCQRRNQILKTQVQDDSKKLVLTPDEKNESLAKAIQASLLTHLTSKIDAKSERKEIDASKLKSKFILDCTLPDASQVEANENLTKTWMVQNNGNDPWPSNCKLVCVGGHDLSGPAEGVPLPSLQPGDDCYVTVALKAPKIPGRYVSYWRMITEENVRFGHRFWVDLTVKSPKKSQNSRDTSSPNPYSKELEIFQEMGFEITEGLRTLLSQTKGDISNVLSQLMNFKD